MKKSGIKKQVLTLIISCSLFTLILTTAISLYALLSVRQDAIDVGLEIGDVAAKESGEALHNDAKATLMSHMNERSYRIDMTFANLGGQVRMISEQMTTILAHPELYRGKVVREPSRENEKKLATQLHLAPGLNLNNPELQSKIALTANISDWLTRVYQNSDMVVATYVASKDGYTIMVDERSEKKFAGNESTPTRIDFRLRPWYKDAVKQNDLLYTEPYKDAYSDNRAITCAMPYYDSDGNIAGVVGAGMFLSHINTIVLSTKVGNAGYGFIMRKNGRVLFSPKSFGELKITLDTSPSLFESNNESLKEVAKKMAQGETGISEAIIDGTKCYIAYCPLRTMNASFGIVMDQSEITANAEANELQIKESTDDFLESLNNSIYSTLLAILLVLALTLFMIGIAGTFLADWFVRPIKRLKEGVKEIADGNLDKKLDITTGNEIEELAINFNIMTDKLKEYITSLTKVTAERERTSTELSVATEIQTSRLPNVFPAFPDHKEFDIYATMQAAKKVGGDFYDFYLIDDNHLMITIADVSGKGVPAALFMMISKMIIKNYALASSEKISLDELLSKVNEQLLKGNDAMMFVTAFVATLNLKTGVLVYVNAGHNPPLIYRASKNEYSYMEVHKNFVLGAMDDLSFKEQEIVLNRGDKLFLYTDGVTEALSESGEMFGEDRLLNVLNKKTSELSPKHTLERVRENLKDYVKTAEQSDDITMMSLIFNGMGNNDMERKNSKSITIVASLENLQAAQDFVSKCIEPLKVPMKTSMQIELCIEEIFVNIASYAYDDGKGDATIEVNTLENPSGVEIKFIDGGKQYDPLQKEDPDIDAKLEDRGIGGLGIFLVKNNMDEIEYRYEHEKNIFLMRKFFEQ